MEAQTIRRDTCALPGGLPGATAALVPDAHHGWNGEHPDLFTAMVRRWIDDRALAHGLQRIEGTQRSPSG